MTARIRIDRFVEEDPRAAFVVRPADVVASCEECHEPILADSAGWRKWCEENPDKCYQSKGARGVKSDPWANARALRELSDKIDVVMTAQERTDALVALGREAQRLAGLPGRKLAMDVYKAEVVAAMDSDLAAANRTVELRDMPGNSTTDMPLFRDFQEQVLLKDEEWVRLNGEGDAHAATAASMKDLAKTYPEWLSAGLAKVGVGMGPTADSPGPQVGFGPKLNDGQHHTAENQIAEAIKCVPTRWLDKIGGTGIQVREVDEMRAYYSDAGSEAHASWAADADTYRHEMMHAVESRSVEIHDAQRALLVSRIGASDMTVAEQDYALKDRRQPLNDLVERMENPPPGGSVYGSDEVGIWANFPHPYTSKYYGTGHYEILSTGMQALFSKDPRVYDSIIDDDHHFEQWLLGVIVKTGGG